MNTETTQPEICNIAAALARQAGRQGDNVAIHYPVGKRSGRVQYESISYSALNQLADEYAHGLIEYGIGRGIRTALMLTPGLEFFAMFFALFKAGAVPVLVDPGIGIKPLKICLAEAAPHAFIGVTRAQVARKILGWVPGIKLVTAGPKLGTVLADTQPDEMAAILFTSGSTGIPKGVVYRHRHFIAQVEMLQSAFDIRAGEVDLPTFPPFALFDPAMGMTTVVPMMDPTRPAKADPRLLVQTIERFGVTNIFGSPALLNVLGRYTEAEKISLPSVRRVISAGAAMPVATVRRLQKTLPADAEIYTPYGATECLPVASVSGTELNKEVEQRTASGEGTCIGRPVAPNKVKIIPVTDTILETFADTVELPAGITGEIVVHGPTSTDAYWQRDEQTRLAKMTDSEGRIWHRMGDAGYFDTDGYLWRTALVGVGPSGYQVPVLCVELLQKVTAHRRERIRTDLLQIGRNNTATSSIKQILFHKSFPVDIRHNAKIGREKLSRWAEKELS